MSTIESEVVRDIEVKLARPTDAIVVNGANKFIDNANALIIDSDEILVFANEDLENIKSQYRTLEARREAGKRPILEAGRNWDAVFKPALTTLEAAEKIYKSKIGAFILEQQRIAAEKQRELDEAARRERERLQAEAAEQQRIADEQRRADEARADEERRVAQRIEDEALAEARRLEEAGHAEQARIARDAADRDRLLAEQREADARRESQTRHQAAQQNVAAVTSAAAVTTAVRVAPIDKPKNVSVGTVFKAEGEDLMLTIKAIAAGTAPANLLTFNQPAINAMVKASGAEMKIPGIRVWSEAKVAQRRSSGVAS